MKIVFFFFALLFTLSASAEWPFDGSINIQEVRSAPENFIKDQTGQCRNDPGIHELLGALNIYRGLLAARKTDEAKQELAAIKSISFSGSCNDFLSKVYLAKSLERLLDDQLIEYKKQGWMQTFQTLRSAHALQNGETEMAVPNDVLYLISLYLINKVPITFLDDSVRKDLAQANDDDIWTQPSTRTKGRYEVLGAYACSPQTIYLDASLAPYDLAATWMHETDHLIRDILGPSDIWKDKALDAIRTDELLANVMGAFSQWNVRQSAEPVQIPFGGRRILKAFNAGSRTDMTVQDQFFVNFGDLTFINKKGPLAKLYSPNGVLQYLMQNQILWNRYNVFEMLWAYFTTADWSYRPVETFEPGWAYGYIFGGTHGVVNVPKQIGATDGIVDKAYFGDYAMPAFAPKDHSRQYIILSQWANDITFLRNTATLDGAPDLNAAFQNLQAHLGWESAPCAEFKKAVDRGDLKPYLNRLGKDGSRPERNGKDGSRPERDGKDGARPERDGKDGSRPEDDHKLGKDGARPELTTARPCLDLRDEL